MTAARKPQPERARGALAQLLHHEGRLLPRLRGVFRLDPEVYGEIRGDVRAIPQAFAVVIGTALLASIGQGSLALFFLGIAGAIVVWGAVTGLVWCIGTVVTGESIELPRLLRCLGFAYVWYGLLIGANLPWIGFLFSWAAVGLCVASGVLATRQVLKTTTERALTIYVVSLGIPILLLLVAA